MSAPPYIAGAIATVLSSLWADKHSKRMIPILFFQACVLVSMSVLFKYAPDIADNIPLCYTMVVITCIGVYPIIPANNSKYLNNPVLGLERCFVYSRGALSQQVPRTSRALLPSLSPS